MFGGRSRVCEGGKKKGNGRLQTTGLLFVRPCCDRFIPAEGEANTANSTMRTDKRQAWPLGRGNG